MSDFTFNQFVNFDDDPNLEHADLRSPVLPTDHEELPQEVEAFNFEEWLNKTEEGMSNITQANPTQAELPIPFIADNITVNPQSLNTAFTGFTGNVNPYPAPAEFPEPSTIFPVFNMEPAEQFPAPFEFSGTYQHDILNKFPSPTYPLHIIDSFGYHLPGHVIDALHQGLKRRREFDDEINQVIADSNFIVPLDLEQPPAKKRQISKGKGIPVSVSNLVASRFVPPQDAYSPEDLALSDSGWNEEDLALSDTTEEEPEPKPKPTQAPEPEERVRPKKVPGKKWIKPNLTTQGKNNRTKNIQSFDPSNYYTPLEQPPQSWGTPNLDGVPPFQYTKDGELNPHVKYTVNQIKEFIFNHPGHTISGQRHTKKSGLTLWIQSVPSDSAARYSHQNSDKCRFEDCPVRNGTIHKGHYRVAFDEQSSNPRVTDPFNNAGYVHLFCLEKNLDFPFICANFNVQPDDRVLPEGRNRMAITRDHVEMKRVVQRFVRRAEKHPMLDFGSSFNYENTLSYALTIKHLELEPSNRQSVRDSRPNANSIDKHLNNLDLFVAGLALRAERRKGRVPVVDDASSVAGPSTARPTQVRGNKRKADEIDSDDDTYFEAEADTIVVDAGESSSAPKPRVKRARVSRREIVDDSDSDSDSDLSSIESNIL